MWFVSQLAIDYLTRQLNIRKKEREVDVKVGKGKKKTKNQKQREPRKNSQGVFYILVEQ